MKEEFTHRFIEDVERIQKILKIRGFEYSLNECAGAWDEYSESMAAGWMDLDEEDYFVYENVEPYLDTSIGLKDRFIKRVIQNQIGVDVEDYQIQGIVKKGEITTINIDVRTKNYPEYIDVRFNFNENNDIVE